MKALIDADILLYEVGFGVVFKDDAGEKVISNFDSVINLLEEKILTIQEEVWADEPPRLYLTGSNSIKKFLPKSIAEPLNFRVDVAVSKPYKGNRTQEKPFHYYNTILYILNHYDAKVAWGMEADDLICIDHLEDQGGTIRCTRDKDFKGSPGNLYGWACNRQAGFGPKDIGPEEASRFFYTQMITGDSTDNIPGLPGCGPAAAKKALEGVASVEDMKEAVKTMYKSKGFGKEYFLEQADLLWMCRECNSDGTPKRYSQY